MLHADDLWAISALLSRYCHLIDSGEACAVADQVFGEAAEIDYGDGAIVGREAIRGFFAYSQGQVNVTAHFLSNLMIEGERPGASASCYYQSWRWEAQAGHADPLRPASMVGIGRYDDELVWTEAGWRIVRRRLQLLGPGAIGLGAPPPALVEMFARRAARSGGAA